MGWLTHAASGRHVRHFSTKDLLFPSFVFIIAGILFAGCLVYQTIEYRLVLNSDGKSGSISIEYTNVQSSATDAAHQNDDFAELLTKWKGDKYLLERMDDGIYLRQRSLVLKKGVLVWRESGIFSDVRKLKEGVKYDDTTRVTLAKDQTILSTNGTVTVDKDSTVVCWPPRTRDFRIKIQQQNFEPTSHFAEKFRTLRQK